MTLAELLSVARCCLCQWLGLHVLCLLSHLVVCKPEAGW